MAKRRRFPLCLEALEARYVLSTYYVAPGGNNSNAGSSATPWQTLQFAADRVVAGDLVIVRAGNYAGFYLETDGTATQPITFHGESGATITTRNATTPDGINLEGADYIVIEGFKVINQPRTGIRTVLNHHVTIRNNVCDNNDRWGILTGFSDDLLIENNQTSNSHIEHGIYVSNSGDRPTLRSNLSFGNFANGIHMNGDLSQGGDGIISGALVENNTIYNNGTGGGSGINCDGVQNSVIRNNLIYSALSSGISLYQIDGGGGASGNLVVNNTVLVSSTGRWAMNIQSGSTNNTLRNNIFYSAHSFRGSIDISADSLPGFSSDYNVVMDRFTTDGGDTRLTLAQWQAARGQDVHSLVATPAQLFVNVAGNDYHLSATSPALDRGAPSQAPPTDRDGLPRPSGTGVDLGAFERQVQQQGGTLTLFASAVSVNETAGAVTLMVNRSNGSAGAVSVQYGTSNGTASPGSDYTSITGILNWPDGDLTAKTIVVPILDDPAFEGNETFTVTLSNPAGEATLGSPVSASVTILDNDTQPPPNNARRRVVAAAEAGAEPRVRIFDGATGQEVFSILPYPSAFRGGVRVATADFNGDTIPDIVTAPGYGTLTGGQRVRVFDGLTGAPLAGVWGAGVSAYTSAYNRGVNIAVGDFNRDGTPDVVTGTSSGANPLVHVYNGKTGQLLPAPWASFNAYSTTFTGGVRVAAGDVNGDGYVDLITAQAGSTGEVRIFNGKSTTATPALLRSFRPYASGLPGGVSVAVGDLNGDGKAEIITGPAAAKGTVRLYGASNTPLRSFYPFGSIYSGGARVALGDINGDGKLDLVLGQGKGPQAKVRLYDAATLREFFAGSGALTPFPANTGGLSVAALAVTG